MANIKINPVISPVFNNNTATYTTAATDPEAERAAREALTAALSTRQTVEVALVTPPKPRSAVWRAAVVTGLTILFTAAWHATGWSVHDVSVFLAEKGRELVALLGG